MLKIKNRVWSHKTSNPVILQNCENPYFMRFFALFVCFFHRNGTGDSGANHRVVAHTNRFAYGFVTWVALKGFPIFTIHEVGVDQDFTAA